MELGIVDFETAKMKDGIKRALELSEDRQEAEPVFGQKDIDTIFQDEESITGMDVADFINANADSFPGILTIQTSYFVPLDGDRPGYYMKQDRIHVNAGGKYDENHIARKYFSKEKIQNTCKYYMDNFGEKAPMFFINFNDYMSTSFPIYYPVIHFDEDLKITKIEK